MLAKQACRAGRVRITVRTDGGRVIREGCGVGESNAATPGQAHDFAAKAAETDATKRALSTFGNAFGLSLYGSVSSGTEPRSKAGAAQTALVQPAAGGDSKPKTEVADAAPVHSPAVAVPALIPAAAALKYEHSRPLPTAIDAKKDINIFPPDRTQEPEHQGIDKSVLAISAPRRIRDAGHRHFVASHPCVVCGRSPAEAHHVRFAQPRAMGRKVSNQFTVPLCALHHRDLHAYGNELSWWNEKKLNPIDISIDLWAKSRSRSWNGAPQQSQATASDNAALDQIHAKPTALPHGIKKEPDDVRRQ